MPNSDGEVAMNEAHEKLRELLVAIRSVLTKYKECDFEWDGDSTTFYNVRAAPALQFLITLIKLSFSNQATHEIMDRTTELKDFIVTFDYINLKPNFQDDLYNLVDKLAISVRTAFLAILTGFDGISGMACDPTPEVALDRSKIASVSLKVTSAN